MILFLIELIYMEFHHRDTEFTQRRTELFFVNSVQPPCLCGEVLSLNIFLEDIERV